MSRYKALIIGLLTLAGVMLVLTLLPSKQKQAGAPPAPSVGPAKAHADRRSAKPAVKTARKAGDTGSEQTRSLRAEDAAQPRPAEADTGSAGTAAAASPANKEAVAREKAVKAWESLVDQVAEQKDQPPEANAQRLKETFDRLDKADQMDGIRRALNLFPNEQFASLYAILFDKAEDPEVLDAIFSDALNRPEELKNPLMKELRKDREHPLFFESARILDVVEPAEPKP